LRRGGGNIVIRPFNNRQRLAASAGSKKRGESGLYIRRLLLVGDLDQAIIRAHNLDRGFERVEFLAVLQELLQLHLTLHDRANLLADARVFNTPADLRNQMSIASCTSGVTVPTCDWIFAAISVSCFRFAVMLVRQVCKASKVLMTFSFG
jgi:hypothetical protein